MATRARALPRGWYPGSSAECVREIEEFLGGFQPPAGTWKAAVVPHAGWYFSGRAAARAFATLAGCGQPDRVIIYGGHLSGHADPIVYGEDSWDTPLGPQPMDADLAQEIIRSREGVAASASFADNTVEIQLPFVRHFFPSAKLVAVHAPASEQASRLGSQVFEFLTERGLSAVFIGSADLTHYGPNYGFSPKGTGASSVAWVKEQNDRSVIDKALAMDIPGVILDAQQKHNTCSAGPIASVIASAARFGAKQGTLLEYYTSFDIMPGSSFVGYAAIVC